MNKKQLLLSAKPKLSEFEMESGSVFIKEMTGKELEELSGLMEKCESENNLILAYSLCDKDGKRYYTNEEASAFNGFGASLISQLLEVAIDINGMSKKSKDEIAKN